MDIKELQKAIVAEVNRREYERVASASNQTTPLPNDLVRAFELVEIESFLPPAAEPQPIPETAPAAAAAAAPAGSSAPSLYNRLRNLPVIGKYIGHPRVMHLLTRARQRPGHPLKNIVVLLIRGVVLRIPGAGNLIHSLRLLRRLPDIVQTMEHHNAQLRTIGLQLQEQINQSFYSHALAIEQNEQSLIARLRLQEQRQRELTMKLLQPQSPTPSTASQQTPNAPARHEEPGMPHELYLEFEAHFRGSRELIRERLKANLPLFSYAEGAIQPVMDLGCGRGEWLQLLKEAEIPAVGVDSNTAMIQCCTDAGLEAYVGDALQYMMALPDNSLSGLTAFHIIEHVPLDVLIKLIDETKRVVRPGGIILLETPNPENLIVGACNFYVDPTHRNPMPPALVAFLLQARGFERVEIDRRHPADPALLLQGNDEAITTPLNRLLFGAQDYAAIGYVPEQD